MVVSLISQVDYEYRDNNYSNEENDSESIIVSYHTSRKTILLNHLKKENFEKGQKYLQIILPPPLKRKISFRKRRQLPALAKVISTKQFTRVRIRKKYSKI